MKFKNKNIKWTSNIAYAVGLITTDGCLSTDGRHIDFTSKDIQLLNTFKKCLSINNRITSKRSSYTGRKDCFRVQFGNVVFYRWLLGIGLMRNKTKRISSLEIPDKFFFEFLRGHLDGDGCIRVYQDLIYPKSQRIYTSFNSSNIRHLEWLQSTIKRLLNINGYIENKIRIFSLKYAKNDSSVLLPEIYPNSKIPCLKRKYKIVQNLNFMPK